MTDTAEYAPGSIIHVRGRDWIVEADSTKKLLHLRPLAGAKGGSCLILPELEIPEDKPKSAVFPLPSPEKRANLKECQLLQSAMRMRMRSGAGPFRSFGNISVQPRIYQMAPLLMALRQKVIRLLIADDVGIGKTIEAGLIIREMLDRGEVQRFSVLCPSNLAEQWKKELRERFHLKAEIVNPSSIRRMENQCPAGQSVFVHFPFTIISLDYIKNDRHCSTFINSAPEFIIVDEAHTCTSATGRTQQRYTMLRELANDSERHLLLLTATPHSGIEESFYNLLGLLDKDFKVFGKVSQAQRDRLRARLARHLIQRRRNDILKLWAETGVLPKRETADWTYTMSGEWGQFFNKVRQYCVQETKNNNNRMIWYNMLALSRCISSSPAAAISALQARMRGEIDSGDSEEGFTEQFADGVDDSTEDDHEAPSPDLPQIETLLHQAEQLKKSGNDPKLQALVKVIRRLTGDSYSPIVFCQYISTAEYVAENLQKVFLKYTVRAVTGKLSPSEREDAVHDLCQSEKHILVATNCLSEGINLQKGFNAVVHYDLAWNPTRHEQREGRVDRFGQVSSTVRCVMLYGADNPMDSFILKVILRKAITIRNELGVSVPVPVDEQKISEAMVHAVLLNQNEKEASLEQEQALLPGLQDYALDMAWQDASEKNKQRTTTFAQQTLQPQEIKPYFDRANDMLGSASELQSFLAGACKWLGAPLDTLDSDHQNYRLRVDNLPASLRQRLREQGILPPKRESYFRFSLQPAGTSLPAVTRTHPFVAMLAEYLMEAALRESEEGGEKVLRRCAVSQVAGVEKLTVLYQLRLRHLLTTIFAQQERMLMVEEMVTIIAEAGAPPHCASQEEMQRFAAFSSLDNIPDGVATLLLRKALTEWEELMNSGALHTLLSERAHELQKDHQCVREASRVEAGSINVNCCEPPDLLSVLVLRPNL